MKILLAVAGLLLGLAIGASLARHFAAQHRYPRAVMAVAEAQLAQADGALRAGQCAQAADALARLAATMGEVPRALPLTFAQEPQFRDELARLQTALRPSEADCHALGVRLRQVRQRCDDCHRVYR